MKTNWQLITPFDAIVFDCDGTLSSIEGIDELAEMNGVGEEIKAITEEAMTEGKLTLSIYESRLNKVLPTQSQCRTLGELYTEHATPFAVTVIQDLQLLGKSVYIMSAGLLPPVQALGNFLGVEDDCIFAVDILFDSQTGQYKDFDRKSPLTCSIGKAEILKKLKKTHKRIALIGDGMNDLLSAHEADCFIGFGGNYYRDTIAAKSDFFITSKSLLPVLALCATEEEIAGVNPVSSDYARSQRLIEQGEVIFKGERS